MHFGNLDCTLLYKSNFGFPDREREGFHLMNLLTFAFGMTDVLLASMVTMCFKGSRPFAMRYASTGR